MTWRFLARDGKHSSPTSRSVPQHHKCAWQIPSRKNSGQGHTQSAYEKGVPSTSPFHRFRNRLDYAIIGGASSSKARLRSYLIRSTTSRITLPHQGGKEGRHIQQSAAACRATGAQQSAPTLTSSNAHRAGGTSSASTMDWNLPGAGILGRPVRLHLFRGRVMGPFVRQNEWRKADRSACRRHNVWPLIIKAVQERLKAQSTKPKVRSILRLAPRTI